MFRITRIFTETSISNTVDQVRFESITRADLDIKIDVLREF